MAALLLGSGPAARPAFARGFRLRSGPPFSSFSIGRGRHRLFKLALPRNGACITGRNVKLSPIARHPPEYTLQVWPGGGRGRPALRARL